MTSWSYRVIQLKGGPRDGMFYIGEVFYDDEHNVFGHAEAFLNSLDSLDELKSDYEIMKEAFDAPILVFEEETDTYFENGNKLPEADLPRGL